MLGINPVGGRNVDNPTTTQTSAPNAFAVFMQKPTIQPPPAEPKTISYPSHYVGPNNQYQGPYVSDKATMSCKPDPKAYAEYQDALQNKQESKGGPSIGSRICKAAGDGSFLPGLWGYAGTLIDGACKLRGGGNSDNGGRMSPNDPNVA